MKNRKNPKIFKGITIDFNLLVEVTFYLCDLIIGLMALSYLIDNITFDSLVTIYRSIKQLEQTFRSLAVCIKKIRKQPKK